MRILLLLKSEIYKQLLKVSIQFNDGPLNFADVPIASVDPVELNVPASVVTIPADVILRIT